MTGAAIVSLLPLRWTTCANGVTQPVSPLAWSLRTITRSTRAAAESVTDPEPTRAELERLRIENERRERQIGHQQVMIANMDGMVAELSGLRDQLTDPDAKIIFASILGNDTSPERDSITISRGDRHHVKPGDWVAAGDAPATRDPQASAGRDLLLQQWIIGRVSEVQPYTSLVQLATDPKFGPYRVRLARALDDGTWELADGEEALRGDAAGRMRINQAARDYRQAGFTIVLLPLTPSRPMALAVGRIVGSETLSTGLHYDFEVEAWDQVARLSHVYVISLSH